MIYASGVAAADYEPEATTILMHLNGDDQTLDLGPAFFYNLGPDFDRATLPTNPPA